MMDDKSLDHVVHWSHTGSPEIDAECPRCGVDALREENERLKAERAIIDKVLRDSNLDATRWFMVEALRGEGEK